MGHSRGHSDYRPEDRHQPSEDAQDFFGPVEVPGITAFNAIPSSRPVRSPVTRLSSGELTRGQCGIQKPACAHLGRSLREGEYSRFGFRFKTKGYETKRQCLSFRIFGVKARPGRGTNRNALRFRSVHSVGSGGYANPIFRKNLVLPI